MAEYAINKGIKVTTKPSLPLMEKNGERLYLCIEGVYNLLTGHPSTYEDIGCMDAFKPA
jgi:hypothetical protein